VQAPSGHHVHNTDVEVENEEALIFSRNIYGVNAILIKVRFEPLNEVLVIHWINSAGESS
jgi:hypothetical protein